MEKYLLDSSVILDILEGNAEGRQAAKTFSQAEACTSVICYCEVLNKTNLNELNKAEAFLSKLIVFEVTLADGNSAKTLQFESRKTGKHVPTIDCLIAATAINNNAILAASDKDFNRLGNLRKIIF